MDYKRRNMVPSINIKNVVCIGPMQLTFFQKNNKFKIKALWFLPNHIL